MKKEKMNSTEALPDNDMQAGLSLREKAEGQLKKKHSLKAKHLTESNAKPVRSQRSIEPVGMSKGSEADTMKLIHELEVYQIELEMQNEELKIASAKAETATEKYTAIYDFAFTGYFTLDSYGNICELNHSGARMLGRERSTLIKNNFTQFVTIDTRPVFNDFFRKVFETNSKETCELRLIVKGNPSIFVHIEGIVSGDEEKCLVTVVDVTRRKQAEGILQLKAHEFELFNELMETNDQQMTELKKEINQLLKKLGEKEKFEINE